MYAYFTLGLLYYVCFFCFFCVFKLRSDNLLINENDDDDDGGWVRMRAVPRPSVVLAVPYRARCSLSDEHNICRLNVKIK